MSEPNWVDAMAADALRSDDVVTVEIGDRDIAICKLGDTVYAIDNICSHGQARLCEGFLIGHEIECPLHQGRFDVRDGKATYEPAEDPLRSYPVKVEGQRVWLLVD